MYRNCLRGGRCSCNCTWLLVMLGYWPSYNVPFYPIIYNMSGYPDMVDNFGSLLSYPLAPRAKIFRRDQGTVVDMRSMQALMRYNGMYLGQVSCHTSVLQVLHCVQIKTGPLKHCQ